MSHFFFYQDIIALIVQKRIWSLGKISTRKNVPYKFSNESTAAARALHKLLGNLSATSRFSSSVFCFEHLFAF